MELPEAILESWRRQCRCLNALASLITDSNKGARPSEDGMPLSEQLSHTAEVRAYWYQQANGQMFEGYRPLFEQVSDDEWIMSDDLPAIHQQLALSQSAIETWVAAKMNDGTQTAGPYDHPIFYLQHMIWHEGYHVALIMLALRLAGQEPSEEWEDANLWGNWRNYG